MCTSWGGWILFWILNANMNSVSDSECIQVIHAMNSEVHFSLHSGLYHGHRKFSDCQEFWWNTLVCLLKMSQNASEYIDITRCARKWKKILFGTPKRSLRTALFDFCPLRGRNSEEWLCCKVASNMLANSRHNIIIQLESWSWVQYSISV